MTWNTIATIRLTQDWQITPAIAPELGYVRLSFATAGIPVTVAQADSDSGALFDQRHLVASGNSQIHIFESLPVFVDRALALRLPIPAAPFDIQIEVSNMPISRGATSLPTSATVAATSVAAATANTQLLAANANRKMASFTSNSTGILYIELGATASPTAYTVALNQGDTYELPIAYTGVVSAIWSSTNGACLVREFV